MPSVGSNGSPPQPQAAEKETCREHDNAEAYRRNIYKAGDTIETRNSTQTSTVQAFPRNAEAQSTLGDGPCQRTCTEGGCQGKTVTYRRLRAENIVALTKIVVLLDGGHSATSLWWKLPAQEAGSPKNENLHTTIMAGSTLRQRNNTTNKKAVGRSRKKTVDDSVAETGRMCKRRRHETRRDDAE